MFCEDTEIQMGVSCLRRLENKNLMILPTTNNNTQHKNITRVHRGKREPKSFLLRQMLPLLQETNVLKYARIHGLQQQSAF